MKDLKNRLSKTKQNVLCLFLTSSSEILVVFGRQTELQFLPDPLTLMDSTVFIVDAVPHITAVNCSDMDFRLIVLVHQAEEINDNTV